MTLGELKEALYRHADIDEDEEKQKYFPVAVNHALDAVCTVFPLQDKWHIAPLAVPNVLAGAQKEYETVQDAPLRYEANAKAYYFEVSGCGVCDVIDETGLKRIEFNTNAYTPFRGFISGDSALNFHGEYLFFVRNVAMYGTLVSGNVEDIPAFSTSRVYDFKELTKQTDENGDVFYAFDSFLPEKFEEKILGEQTVVPLRDYKIEPDENGHLLRLYGEEETQKIIYYRRNFKPITDASPDETELEIPQGLSYILLDLCVYRMGIDESDISTERARYEANLLLNWKQQKQSGQNTADRLFDEMGYLHYD